MIINQKGEIPVIEVWKRLQNNALQALLYKKYFPCGCTLHCAKPNFSFTFPTSKVVLRNADLFWAYEKSVITKRKP